MHLPRRWCALALALALPAACGRPSGDATPAPEPPPSAAAAAAPASAAASDAAPASAAAPPTPKSSAAASPPPAPSGPTPLSDADKATAAAYLKALGRGRKATRSKDFSAAIAAFDEALKIRPNDGVALGERGYARLQAKELDAARKDLDEARERAGSPEIVAQVLYNLGLLEEQAGAKEASQALLNQARTLREQIKQGKGAAPSGCPISVSRPDIAAERLDSWSALWKRVLPDFKERFGDDFPAAKLGLDAAEGDIRRELGAKEGSGPWLVHMTGESVIGDVWHLVGQQPDGKLLLFLAVGERRLARCRYGTDSARLEIAPVPHVILEGITDEYGYVCEKKGGALEPCKGEEGELPVQSYCGSGTYAIVTTFYDMAAGRALLQTEETGLDDKRASVSVVAQRDGIVLAGAGCSGKEPFTR